MLPIDIYKTSRRWWKKRWQAEPIDSTVWDKAVTGYTYKGTLKKALRKYESGVQ